MTGASSASLPELAGERQQELDTAIAAWRTADGAGVRLWCGPGCGNCCTLAVNTTLPEAERISAALDPDQRAALNATVSRLITHATGCRQSVRLYLTGYREAVGPCPFLDAGGNCSIYGGRPLACRALFATRPPQWCGVNLATLPGIERNSFLESLDRSVAAYPTHYAAAPQQLAEQIEQGLIFAMLRVYGFGVTGSLPLMVWLANDPRCHAALTAGLTAFRNFIDERGLALPFLMQIHEP